MKQKERVLERLKQEGYVDNFWAIQNRMLRLGAIIHELKRDGYEFKGAFGKDLGKDRNFHKNYYYHLVTKPTVTAPSRIQVSRQTSLYGEAKAS